MGLFREYGVRRRRGRVPAWCCDYRTVGFFSATGDPRAGRGSNRPGGLVGGFRGDEVVEVGACRGTPPRPACGRCDAGVGSWGSSVSRVNVDAGLVIRDGGGVTVGWLTRGRSAAVVAGAVADDARSGRKNVDDSSFLGAGRAVSRGHIIAGLRVAVRPVFRYCSGIGQLEVDSGSFTSSSAMCRAFVVAVAHGSRPSVARMAAGGSGGVVRGVGCRVAR